MKTLITITIISFISSIFYSLYFSNEIVKHNVAYQNNQNQYTSLTGSLQYYQSQYLNLTNLDPNKFPDLIPITKYIDLSHEP